MVHTHIPFTNPILLQWNDLMSTVGRSFFGDSDLHIAASNQRWERYYKCFSPSFAGKPDIEKGNKILLPPSALQDLARLNVTWPMLFELRNNATSKKTHCGVLEFVAEEGCCNLPYWMMQNLLLEEGDLLHVTNTSLPKGTYVKLQPVTSNFLEISNPRAVLENALRHFSTLTVGDCICIQYNEQIFEIEIVDTKPQDAISIIETDVDVDFAPPKDYVEPQPVATTQITTNTETSRMSDDESESRPPRFVSHYLFRLRLLAGRTYFRDAVAVWMGKRPNQKAKWQLIRQAMGMKHRTYEPMNHRVNLNPGSSLYLEA